MVLDLADRNRCLKSGMVCDGYAPSKIRLFDPLSSSQHTSGGPAPADLAVVQSQDLSIHSIGPSYGTPEEYHSLQFFLEKTSDLISVYSQPRFWTVILPQLSWQQASLKHSVVALSILHESLSRIPRASIRETEQLMFHYNTAIRALVRDRPAVEVVLATCVIFWALENFNGSGRAAFDHMKAAFKILDEWKNQRRTNDPAHNLISMYIEPIIHDGMKFASAGRIEEVINDLTEESEIVFLTQSLETSRSIQLPSFSTLDEASDHLVDCVRQLLHLTLLDLDTEQARLALRDAIPTIDAKLDQWIGLFHKLTATGPPCQRRLLVVHNIAAHILLDQLKTITQHEEQADSRKSRYSFIVHEMDELLEIQAAHTLPARRMPILRLGTFPPLFLVAVACPDVAFRGRALNALRASHYHEGLWNGEVAASIAETIVMIQAEVERTDTGGDPLGWLKGLVCDRGGPGLRLRADVDGVMIVKHVECSDADLIGVDCVSSDLEYHA